MPQFPGIKSEIGPNFDMFAAYFRFEELTFIGAIFSNTPLLLIYRYVCIYLRPRSAASLGKWQVMKQL